MKALKIIGVSLFGLVGLAVLLYVIGVAVNWRDQPPSAAAIEMKKILADRARVADADNGFVYVMGFSAPASEDSQATGALRMAWLEAVNRDPGQIDADSLKEIVNFSASASRSMDAVKKSCGDTHPGKCRDAFLAASQEPRSGLEELQLARYRALLKRPGWREVVPLDIRAPLPAYSNILEGQRLLMVDLAARAKSAPPGEIASALLEDLAFWRETQKSADLLITKMIAIAAIRQHFSFGNFVLREMPADRTKVIEAWSVPFGAGDLSMRRTMAGELFFAEGVMLSWHHGYGGSFIEPGGEGSTLPGRIASSLVRPYYQHQDQMNYYAGLYLDFSKRFEAPLERYAEIAKAEQAGEAAPVERSFHVYNATGHAFRGMTGTVAYAGYPLRVGSIEGMRRAALLTTQLRERGVPPDQMAAELVGAALRNPFDSKPFEWSAEEQAVVYVGPEAERDRKRHPYFY
jgi:hypothetical protein